MFLQPKDTTNAKLLPSNKGMHFAINANQCKKGVPIGTPFFSLRLCFWSWFFSLAFANATGHFILRTFFAKFGCNPA